MNDDTLTAEKLEEIEARLRTYCDGIQGKNELKVGLLMCNAAMLKAADALKAQAAKIERMTRYDEPPLTCPHIDRLFSTDIPDDIREELEAIRDINSQLRHGLWAQKDRAEEATARATAAEAMVGALTKALSADGLKRSIDEMRPFTGKRGSIRIGTDEAHLIVALYDAALGAKP